jgi:hypothetical protein
MERCSNKGNIFQIVQSLMSVNSTHRLSKIFWQTRKRVTTFSYAIKGGTARKIHNTIHLRINNFTTVYNN